MSKDTIYREDAIKAINARSNWYQVTCNGKQIAVMLMAKDVNEILEKVPSADRPQGEVDAIDRDALIDYCLKLIDVERKQGSDVMNYGQERVNQTEAIIDYIEDMPHVNADRPQREWIDCKEPPSTDRNVFIAYGTDDMKSVCIGHYEHDMKLWYEDRNFFAKPLYDGMYWCEIPQFPTRMKGADDE